jgi:phosphoribosylanthranilate isomerase
MLSTMGSFWASTPLSKIKVCGLTRSEDVASAVILGADLVGFVLAPSPRAVSIERLTELVRDVPATILTVAVVVDTDHATVDALLDVVDRVQFHGHESPDFCARYGRRGIKAFQIREKEDVGRVLDYRGCVGAYLLDSYKKGQAGGTGHVFTWDYLESVTFDAPTFLAGGLNPANIEDAMQVRAVIGYDLSSGLEDSPGIKDEKLMQEFFRIFDQAKRRPTCKP